VTTYITRQNKIKISQNGILEIFSRSNLYMADATPSPTQIIIQKIDSVIIPNPNFFLKLTRYLTSVRKAAKKQLESLNF